MIRYGVRHHHGNTHHDKEPTTMSPDRRSTTPWYDRALTFIFHTAPITILALALINIGTDMAPRNDTVYYAVALMTGVIPIIIIASTAWHAAARPCTRCARLRHQGADAAKRHLPVLRLYHYIAAIIAILVLLVVIGIIATSFMLSWLPASGRAAFLPEKVGYYTIFVVAAAVARAVALHSAYRPWCPLIERHGRKATSADTASAA